jgi:hypothetical protein
LIQLKSQYDLEPGTVLKLPIDVPQEYLSLYGLLPPRLENIRAQNRPGVYGIGDIIVIEMKFTRAVHIADAPTLTVNTGCNSPSCYDAEVQSFVCTADRGQFAIRMENQFIMNINWNTTKDQFKYMLESLEGINEVAITYDDAQDRQYSGGDRICTTYGKNVTITFVNVTFPQYNGNVPTFQYDPLNAFAHLRSGMSMGTGLLLTGVHTSFQPSVTSAVLNEGFQRTDGTAEYVNGTGTDTVIFNYVAKIGDYANPLEVISINFNAGYIYDNITLANVSTAVPVFGGGPRYMSIRPGSLSFNTFIIITSAQPQILRVTSPNADGVYTQGDNIYIWIVYDLPVKIYDGSEFYVLLNSVSGGNFRVASFQSIINNTVVEFLYTVQGGDSASHLDINNINAFQTPGGQIYRKTSTNDTLANTTLPFPASDNSLYGTKFITIDTTPPQIVSVTATSSSGTYTAGDDVTVQVVFSNPVLVEGTPILWIRNVPGNSLSSYVRTAPALPHVVFERALPNSIVAIVLNLVLNWGLDVGDNITVALPTFYITDESTETYRTLYVRCPEANFTGVWYNDTNYLYLTALTAVSAFKQIDLTVEARNGIFLPSIGVSENDLPSIRVSVVSRTTSTTLDHSVPFKTVGFSGLQDVSLGFTPIVNSTRTLLRFSVTPVEPFVAGDVIYLSLPGFYLPNITFYSVASSGVVFNWSEAEYLMSIELMTGSSSLLNLQQSFVLTNYIPLHLPVEGLLADSLSVSAITSSSGNVMDLTIPNTPNVCSVCSPSVMFAVQTPGVASAATFTWSACPLPVAAGDSFTFTFSNTIANFAGATAIVWRGYIQGPYKRFVMVTIRSQSVRFTLLKPLRAFQAISVTLSKDVGLTIPSAGLTPSTDKYSVLPKSTGCLTFHPLSFHFEQAIIAVYSPKVTYSSADHSSYSGIQLLNDSVLLSFHFQLNTNLQYKDTFSITVPHFRYPYQHKDPCDIKFNSTMVVPATACYNHYSRTLDFTVADNVTAFKPIRVALNQNSNFTMSARSLPSNTFQLSVRSFLGGNVDNVVMATTCLGLCVSNVAFSSVYVKDALTLTFTLSYYANLYKYTPIGFVFNSAFARTSASTSPVAVLTVAGNSYTPTMTCSYASLNCTFALPVRINKNTQFVVTLTGAVVTDNVFVTKPSIYMNLNNSIATKRFDGIPTVFFNSSVFEESRMFFSNTKPGANTTILWSFRTGEALTVSYTDEIVLLLTNFVAPSVNSINISFTHGDTMNTTGLLAEYTGTSVNDFDWNPSTYELTLYMGEIFGNKLTYNVSIAGFTLPAVGVASVFVSASNVTTVLTGYSVVKDISASGVARSQTNTIELLDAVLVIYQPKISFAIYQEVLMKSMTVSFSANMAISRGDVLSMSLPEFRLFAGATTALEIMLPVISVSASGSSVTTPTAYTSAVFHQSNHSLVFTMLHGMVAGSVSITLNCTNVLSLPAHGVGGGVYSSMILLLQSVGQSTQTSALIPCVGVCAASLVPAVTKPGFATNYTLTVQFGLVPFGAANDELVLYLDGFNRSLTTNLTMCVGSSASSLPSSQLTWSPAASTLTITQDKTCSNSTAIKYTASNTFVLMIPINYHLQLPDEGIRSGSIHLSTATAELRNISYIPASGQATLTAPVLSVPPVGYALNSSLVIHDITPNQRSNMTMRFMFADDLQIGDQIVVFMTDFGILNTSLQFVAISNFDGFVITGINQTEGLISGMTSPVTHVAKIIITMTSILPAYVALECFFPETTNIMIPLRGVSTDYPPDFAVISSTSPIDTTNMEEYTVIGSLNPSAVDIVAQDEIGLITSFKLHFTTSNCALQDGDIIVAYLPNVYFYGKSVKFQPVEVAVPYKYYYLDFFNVSSRNRTGYNTTSHKYDLTAAHGHSNFTLPNITTLHNQSLSNITHVYVPLNISMEWRNHSSQLLITINQNASALPDHLDITILSSFFLDATIRYPNSSDVQYSVISSSCPVDKIPFNRVSPGLLLDSELVFSKLVPGEETTFKVGLTPVIYLSGNYSVVVTIPHVNHSYAPGTMLPFGSSTNQSSSLMSYIEVLNSSATTVNQTDSSKYIYSGIQFQVFLNSTVHSRQLIEFMFPGTVLLPSFGIPSSNNGITLAVRKYSFQKNKKNHTTTLVVKGSFTGTFRYVTFIGVFSNVEVRISATNPTQMTGLNLTWQLSGAIGQYQTVVFNLPGFYYKFNPLLGNLVNVSNPAFAEGLIPMPISPSCAGFGQFGALWDNMNSNMILVSLWSLPADTVMSVDIPAGHSGLFPPRNGINADAYMATIASTSTDALSDPVPIDGTNIDGLLYVQSSVISFMSADTDRATMVGGDVHSIEMYPMHTFTPLDIGSRVSIQKTLYTIMNVTKDVLTIKEPYVGDQVLLGVPYSPIDVAPIRPAYYVSGSTTANLLFRYQVQRGDTSLHGLYSQNLTSTKYITKNVDLTGANILRISEHPVVIADATLPTSYISSGIIVNTDIPRILQIFSTSMGTVYSVGDKIDFQVVFDLAVVMVTQETDPNTGEVTYVQGISGSKPYLFLQIAPFGRVQAFYDSGSGTDTLVFVYTVASVDYDFQIGTSDLIENTATIYQPLRIITATFTQLMRKSVEPMILANLTMPPEVGAGINYNISVDGRTPHVVRRYVLPKGTAKPYTSTSAINSASKNPKDYIFTAGDILRVVVVMSDGVTVFKDAVNPGSAYPFVQLNVGRSTPAYATIASSYFDIANITSLLFEYTITGDDAIASGEGLYIHCDCDDYFGRSRIHVNGTRIVQANHTSVAASVIIALDSSKPARLLSSILTIDNTAPRTIQLSANTTSVGFISPGSVVLIYLVFSFPVSVFGVSRLELKGETSVCYAHYYAGNNTEVLTYRYYLSSDSGIARLDCNSVDSFDTTLGATVLRFSDNPTIPVYNKFPVPGSGQSMGLLSPMAVNPGLANIVGGFVTAFTDRTGAEISTETNIPTMPILPLSSFDFTFSPFSTYQLVNQYVQEHNPVLLTTADNNLVIASAFEREILESIAVTQISSVHTVANTTATNQYSVNTYYVATESGLPFEYGAQLGRQLSTNAVTISQDLWWSNFVVQSSVDINIVYDRPVTTNNAYLTVNSHPTSLNRAFSQTYGMSFLLVVDVRNVDPLLFYQQYRIGYGGLLTTCITVSASAQGPFSIQDAIAGVPELNKLGPTTTTSRTLSRANYTVFELNFTRPLLHPLTVHSRDISCTYPLDIPYVGSYTLQMYEYVFIAPSHMVTYSYPIRR